MTSSARGLCIFCLITRDLRPRVARTSIPSNCRRLSTTHPTRQSAAAAGPDQAAGDLHNVEDTLPSSHLRQGEVWNAGSALSSAEQAEKQRRRQRRLIQEAEQERRNIEALQQREAAVRAAQDQRRSEDIERREVAARAAEERARTAAGAERDQVSHREHWRTRPDGRAQQQRSKDIDLTERSRRGVSGLHNQDASATNPVFRTNTTMAQEKSTLEKARGAYFHGHHERIQKSTAPANSSPANNSSKEVAQGVTERGIREPKSPAVSAPSHATAKTKTRSRHGFDRTPFSKTAMPTLSESERKDEGPEAHAIEGWGVGNVDVKPLAEAGVSENGKMLEQPRKPARGFDESGSVETPPPVPSRPATGAMPFSDLPPQIRAGQDNIPNRSVSPSPAGLSSPDIKADHTRDALEPRRRPEELSSPSLKFRDQRTQHGFSFRPRQDSSSSDVKRPIAAELDFSSDLGQSHGFGISNGGTPSTRQTPVHRNASDKRRRIFSEDALSSLQTSGAADPMSNSSPSGPEQPRHHVPTQRPFSDENEYHATPFDASDMQASQQEYDGIQSATWQHLSRRQTQPPVQSPPPPTPPSTASGRALRPRTADQRYDDADYVDRQFREYQQRRPQYHSPSHQAASGSSSAQDASTGSHNAPPTSVFSPGPRCARCLEPGHNARDCTGPVRGSCNYCKEVGHWTKDCPKLTGTQRLGQTGRSSREPGSYSLFNVAPDSRDLLHRQERPLSGQNDLGRSRTGQPTSQAAGRRDGTAKQDQRSSPFGFAPHVVEGASAGHSESQPQSRTSTGFQDQEPKASDRQSFEERRARRSKRGFEDAVAISEQQSLPDRRQRRKGRAFEREDDEADDEAESQREERAARKAARKAERKAQVLQERQMVELPEFISVQNLSQALDVRYDSFVMRLENLGYDNIFPNKVFNAETSGMIAMEYEFDPVFEAVSEVTEEEERDLRAEPEIADATYLPSRPPVVTIMGHVDHGKTTILDFLRQSSVAAGEAGGITQHIGAFSVPMASSGRSITFLDTPGHAAFLSMRQRGANVTDIVVLVVAADDSVKPQTLESLRCAKEAGVPIIVAINKVDKEEADVQRVKQDLSRHGVEIEDFGGETQVVLVSGKTGQGMDELEEAIVTLSEILDHRAQNTGRVEGWVLEATTKSWGRVATILVKRGTIGVGDVIVAGRAWAKVRTLRNEGGKEVQEVGPGLPVEVDGWREQAVAGDEVLQAPSEQKAGDVVEYRIEQHERRQMAVDTEAINESRRMEQEKRAREKAAEQAQKRGEVPPTSSSPQAQQEAANEQQTTQISVPIIIKADVSGSAEAVAAYIPSLTSPLITPRILHASVGPVHESDIELAAAAEGHIVAFNLPPAADVKAEAEARGVKILENNIIYRVLDDVKAILEERLPPIVTQRVLGEADIGASFEIGVGGRKKVWIAGCKVRNGVIAKGAKVRVLRGGEKVYDGTIDSLKNVKKDVQEMRKGTECGMGFEEWQGFEVGDQVQTYEVVTEKRRL